MTKYASYEAIAKYDAEAAYLHILLGKVRPFCCKKQHTCLSNKARCGAYELRGNLSVIYKCIIGVITHRIKDFLRLKKGIHSWFIEACRLTV